MTLFVISVSLLFLVYADTRMMRQRDKNLYRETLEYSPCGWACLSALAFVVIGPVYLIRRRVFRKQIAGRCPSEALQDFFYATDALGIVITWALVILGVAAVSRAAQAGQPLSDMRLGGLVVTAIVSSVLMIGLIYHRTQRAPYQGFWVSVGLHRNNQPAYKIIWVPFAVGATLAYGVARIMIARPLPPRTPLSDVLEANTSSVALALFFITALIVAPFVEEVIFRGYFFSILKRLKGTRRAVAIIAAIFTVMHIGQYWGDWLAICIVALLGVSLTYMRAWTGSTIASCVGHYSYNIFVVVLPIILFVWFNPSFSQYLTMGESLDVKTRQHLLEESVKVNPLLEGALHDLARLYVTQNKNLDQALLLIDRALRHDPENSAYLDTKALVLFRLGRVEEAVETQTRAVAHELTNALFRKQLEQFRIAAEN